MHWIDLESPPEITGKVERSVLNTHGEVDGFVMKDQAEMPTLVHTPPHLADELTREMKAGAKVGVRGVRPRGAHLIAAPAVTAENGRQIVDRCPEHDRKHPKLDHRKMEAKGTVRLSLFGPKGELRGALLADGTILRLSPRSARACRYGLVIEVKSIGAEPGALWPVHKPKPKSKPKPKPKHHLPQPNEPDGAHA